MNWAFQSKEFNKLSASKTPNKEGNRYVLNAQDVKNIKDLMGFDNDKSSTSESTNRLVDYDVYLDVIDSIKEKDEQWKYFPTPKILDPIIFVKRDFYI
ncbi:hypothetical protein LOX62_04880 [Latilactobacillus sakei]|nr:hypothetical protein [Latilactobacillus sakei]MCP8853715.1 hypothetical protein [Latilactobacillus sakei]